MKFQEDYIINLQTCSIGTRYDELGHEGSIVLEREKILLVKKSPLKIIDNTLLSYGFNYEGARAGSRHLLHNKNMNPIVINEKLGIYLIPTMSHTRKECVWFTLHQYYDRTELDKRLVRIMFKNGGTLPVISSLKSFDNKLDKARKLKYIVEEGPSNGFYRNEITMPNYKHDHMLGGIILDPNTNVYSVSHSDQRYS